MRLKKSWKPADNQAVCHVAQITIDALCRMPRANYSRRRRARTPASVHFRETREVTKIPIKKAPAGQGKAPRKDQPPDYTHVQLAEQVLAHFPGRDDVVAVLDGDSMGPERLDSPLTPARFHSGRG